METQKKPRRKYNADFKAQVLKMIANEQPVTHIARSLSIGEALIYRWKKEASDQTTQPSSLLAENLNLKARLKESEKEKEILKKALAIFSQNPLT